MARHRRARHLRRWGWLAVAFFVVAYHYAGAPLRERLGLGRDRPHAKGDRLRVVTWNLRNLGADEQTDLELVAARLHELDADLLALQEVRDEATARRLLPNWELRLSEHGGRGDQRLGFAFDPKRFEILDELREFDELSLDGRVRPLVAQRLRALPAGPDFWIATVHLKARPQGYETRQTQWNHLARVIEGLAEDRDLILLGDFNATGMPKEGIEPEAELAALDVQLARVGLRRLPVEPNCSAYWEGSLRDAWKESSLLDLIWIRDLDGSIAKDQIAHPGTHCARHQCDRLRSTKAYPTLNYARVSDHCPVYLDLQPGHDND